MQGAHGKAVRLTAGENLLCELQLPVDKGAVGVHFPDAGPVGGGLDGAVRGHQILVHNFKDVRVRLPEKLQMGLHSGLSCVLVCREMQ